MRLIPDQRLTALYKNKDKEIIQVFANDSGDTKSEGHKTIHPIPNLFNLKQVYKNCKGLEEEGILYIYLFRVKKNYYALFIPMHGFKYALVSEHKCITSYLVYTRSLYKLNAAEAATLLL